MTFLFRYKCENLIGKLFFIKIKFCLFIYLIKRNFILLTFTAYFQLYGILLINTRQFIYIILIENRRLL